jgi:hypothetical protein
VRLDDPAERGVIFVQVPDLLRLDELGRSRSARSESRTSDRSSPPEGEIQAQGHAGQKAVFAAVLGGRTVTTFVGK